MTYGATTATERETERQFREAIQLANIPTLLMILVQLTGERRWLQDPYRPSAPRGVDDNDSGGLPARAQSDVRDAALAAIIAWRSGRPAAIPNPDPEMFVEMLSVSMGEQIPQEYGEMMAADLGAVLSTGGTSSTAETACVELSAVIIGAGISGLCAAVRLINIGVSCVVLERNDDLGGTWLENRYPGAGVDTPSHLYEYSFAPHDWPHYFASRDEVHEYLRKVADRFDLRRNIRFGAAVRLATFDETANRWTVEFDTADGTREAITSDLVVSAVGAFNNPKMPNLPGIERFQGASCHTARWTDLNLVGKRVAVIGNGASAMQTVPAIVDQAESLTVFQRSSHWVSPFDKFKKQVPEPIRFLMREVPLYHAWYRERLNWMWNDKLHASLRRDPDWPHPERSLNATNDRHRQYFTAYLQSELTGRPDLVDKLLPPYPPYGKRMLFDNGWYKSLRRDHVRLVTTEIREIREHSIVTTDDDEVDVDTIIFATGFDVVRFLSTIEVRGRASASLSSVWDGDDAKAYLGLAVPGFPNFFVLYGPNTQPGHGGSLIAAVEAQMEFVVGALVRAQEWGLPAVEISQQAFDDYTAQVDALHETMVWTHPGMDTYYRNSRGRVVVGSPFRIVDFWTFARHLEPRHLAGASGPVIRVAAHSDTDIRLGAHS